MNNELYDQIYNSLNLKDTDELLDIWQANDHVEWSDSAFEAIKQILTSRRVELPEQDEPILEYSEESDETYGFSEEELKIIDDENPPEFYNPIDVLMIAKQIKIAAIASIILVIVSILLQFQDSENLARSYLQTYPPLNVLVLPITLVSITIAIALSIVTTYFPLQALAHILKILMEMEFNSRIDK